MSAPLLARLETVRQDLEIFLLKNSLQVLIQDNIFYVIRLDKAVWWSYPFFINFLFHQILLKTGSRL